MTGFFPVFDADDLTDTTVTYDVDNIVGDSSFFIPSFTNTLNESKLLGANMELSSENRCDCLIPANSGDVLVGYFRLFSNSNCRLYEEQSGYTGSFIFWDEFAGDVEVGSGLIAFTIEDQLLTR